MPDELPSAPVAPSASAAGLGPPHFNHLTLETLAFLRQCILHEREPEIVAAWCFRVMRFCEIYIRVIRARFRAKWPQRGQRKLAFEQVLALMLDQYASTDDLRYLNIALKLDARRFYVRTRPEAIEGIGAEIALLHARNTLVLERAVSVLSS